MHKRGFTLVELAIVITIIGLLIGGVLKGQELLENARITSTWNNTKAYETAVVTFRDIYKALPGDMLNPGNFLEGCTASPCSTSGDGNGMIGVKDQWGTSTENEIFWVHLARAKLANGININPAWTAADHFGITGPQPTIPIGDRWGMIYLSIGWNVIADPPQHFYHSLSPTTPYGSIMKYDLKFDDGKARRGSIMLHPSYPAASDGISYDPNNKSMAQLVQRAEF